MRKFTWFASLVFLMWAIGLLNGCALVDLTKPQSVIVPGTPEWLPESVSRGAQWEVYGPVLAHNRWKLAAEKEAQAIVIDPINIPVGGSWLLAVLTGSDGSVLAELGCVWGQVVGGPTENKTVDIPGGAVGSLMEEIEKQTGKSTRRFNHERLYRELRKRTEDLSWMINKSRLLGYIGSDSFRSDQIVLPPRPEKLKWPLGTVPPDPVAEGWRSLDNVCASAEAVSRALAQGLHEGTWRFYGSQTCEKITLGVRGDGRVTIMREKLPL